MSSLSTGELGTQLNGKNINNVVPDPAEWGKYAPRVERLVKGRRAVVMWEGSGGERAATHGVIDAVLGGEAATVVLSPVLETYEAGPGEPLRRCPETPLDSTSFTLTGSNLGGCASIHLGAAKIDAALSS